MPPPPSILQAVASGELQVQLPNTVENILFSFLKGKFSARQ